MSVSTSPAITGTLGNVRATFRAIAVVARPTGMLDYAAAAAL
ncbi:MAG: hypothetical protein QOH63_2174 [Acidobacteriota bacterium]|jgi:hypothetical protein|nr:hypothetical protein [Acidobacteriota bacterium]